MAGGPAICGIGRPFGQGNTAFDEACGASSPPAAKAALALAARQIVPPTVVLGTSHLGVDEAVDALVGDHLAAGLARQPAGDLFGRPTALQTVDHRTAQEGLPVEAGRRPAPR